MAALFHIGAANHICAQKMGESQRRTIRKHDNNIYGAEMKTHAHSTRQLRLAAVSGKKERQEISPAAQHSSALGPVHCLVPAAQHVLPHTIWPVQEAETTSHHLQLLIKASHALCTRHASGHLTCPLSLTGWAACKSAIHFCEAGLACVTTNLCDAGAAGIGVGSCSDANREVMWR